MSTIKRLMEDLTEHENEVFELVMTAKIKRPALFKMVDESPNTANCKKLFDGLSDNPELVRLAVSAICWNYDFNA